MEKIKFNQKIYSLDMIKETAKQFKDLAEIKINPQNNYIEVQLDEIDQKVREIIKDEFANYVLGLMS